MSTPAEGKHTTWEYLRGIFFGLPWRKTVLYIAAICALFYMVAPFAWVFITSFMTRAEAMSVPPHWIPQEPTIINYQAYWDPEVTAQWAAERRQTVLSVTKRIPRALLNSASISLAVAVLNMAIGSLAAYPFARYRFRGKQAVLVFYLATRMVPALALLIPIYMVLRSLRMLDSLVGLSFSYLAFTLPYSIWILKNYFQTIPRDLEDAARVDRCNWLQAMIRVMLPVATPGLVAVGIFSFMSSYGEFFYASVLTQTMKSRTVPVLVAYLSTDLGIEYGFLASAAVMAVIPPLVLALIFQRMIITGIAAGAVKG